VLERSRAIEKELQQLKSRLAGASGKDLTAEAREIAGIRVLANRLDDGTDAKTLREVVDRMKDRLGTAVVVLGAATEDGKVRLAAGVTRDAIDRVRAGDVVNAVAERVGGKGGGRPDFAQAGGTDAGGLDAALASVPEWIARHLGKA
jgi:alanyl-tRNA synthetase